MKYEVEITIQTKFTVEAETARDAEEIALGKAMGSMKIAVTPQE